MAKLMIWGKTHTRILVAVAGLGLGALAVSGYVGERERRVRAETVAETQASVQKQLTGQIADLQRQMSERDSEYKHQLQSLTMEYSKALTPQQIADLAATTMGLKQPIQIVTPAPTKENTTPQPIAQVSTEDAPQVKAYLQACEECRLERPKLQADLADRMAQQAAAQKEIDSLKTERDGWRTAAKGGSFWTRTKKAARYIAIGAAVGYVAARR